MTLAADVTTLQHRLTSISIYFNFNLLQLLQFTLKLLSWEIVFLTKFLNHGTISSLLAKFPCSHLPELILSLTMMFCLLILWLTFIIPKQGQISATSQTTSFSTLQVTATQQHSCMNSPPARALIAISRPKRLSAPNLLASLIILAGDIQLNPGPESSFTICTLNTRSLLNSHHKAAMFDLADSFHPNVFALSETWIRNTTTPSELRDATPDGYSLLSQPRSTDSANIGGGLAFLVKEPCQYQNTPSNTFQTFENLAITLKLTAGKLTIFNVYRPPTSSKYTGTFSTFLTEFDTFLSSVVPTPNKFLITGDFNIHVNNQTNNDGIAFMALLSAYNLKQMVNFPTHTGNNTLDLVIIPENDFSSLTASTTTISPSDHYPVLCTLNVTAYNSKPATSTKSFRRIYNIDPLRFSNDIQNSQIAYSNLDSLSLSELINLYNTILSTLLDKHAPIIKTQVSSPKSNPWYNPVLAALKRKRRKLERTWNSTHSIQDLHLLREATKQYHKLTHLPQEDCGQQ